MTKTVYRYDENGYYLGTDRAFESPLEQGVFHIPAYCTEAEPPAEKDGFKRKWNNSAWEYEEIPKEPEPPEPTLEELKTAKLLEVDAWTARKIVGGFTSSCSGEQVTYDSDTETQITMQGIALNVNSALFAEKYPTGCPVRGYPQGSDTKQIYMLSPEQVMLWQADLSIHIGTCKQEGWEKQAEVAAAQSKEDLDAIVLEAHP